MKFNDTLILVVKHDLENGLVPAPVSYTHLDVYKRQVEEVVTTFELPAGWLAAHGYPTTPAEVQRILSDGNLGTDELFEALDHDRENLSQDVAVTERDFSVDDVEPSELCSECQELRRCAELADAGTDPLRDMPTRWWHCQECGEHLERCLLYTSRCV